MLIIDGVSIYELDEECLKKKKMPLDPDVYIHKTVDKTQEKEVETVSNSGGPNYDSKVVVKPDVEPKTEKKATSNKKNNVQKKVKPSIIELANNPDFSIATISKEAKRLKERDEGEVFISLH